MVPYTTPVMTLHVHVLAMGLLCWTPARWAALVVCTADQAAAAAFAPAAAAFAPAAAASMHDWLMMRGFKKGQLLCRDGAVCCSWPSLTLLKGLAILHQEKHVEHKIKPCSKPPRYTNSVQFKVCQTAAANWVFEATSGSVAWVSVTAAAGLCLLACSCCYPACAMRVVLAGAHQGCQRKRSL
jgi:hypothetical protein